MTTEISLPVLQRGDTVPYVLYWKSGDKPVNMTGKRVILTLKLHPFQEDAEAVVSKIYDVPLDDAEGERGVTALVVESDESKQLVAGHTYHLAVRVLMNGTPDPVETTFFTGRVPVRDA